MSAPCLLIIINFRSKGLHWIFKNAYNRMLKNLAASLCREEECPQYSRENAVLRTGEQKKHEEKEPKKRKRERRRKIGLTSSFQCIPLAIAPGIAPLLVKHGQNGGLIAGIFGWLVTKVRVYLWVKFWSVSLGGGRPLREKTYG